MADLQWTHTITWGERVTVTVERRRVRHRMLALALYKKLPGDVNLYIADRFVRLATQTTRLEGVEQAQPGTGEQFKFPELGAPDETWQATFGAFLELDDGFVEAWMNALEHVDAPPGPREALPPERLTDAEKKESGNGG